MLESLLQIISAKTTLLGSSQCQNLLNKEKPMSIRHTHECSSSCKLYNTCSRSLVLSTYIFLFNESSALYGLLQRHGGYDLCVATVWFS